MLSIKRKNGTALTFFIQKQAPKLRYNYIQKEWHYAPASAKLKYNYIQDKYEFVAPNSKLKHNPQSNTYEFVQSSIDPYKSDIGAE